MMKRYYLLCLLFLLAPSLPALAQIEITAADIMSYYGSQNTTLTSHDADDPAALQGLVALTGAGQTWDFTGTSYTATETAIGRLVTPPVPGSEDPHFADANLVWMNYIGEEANPDSVAYSFARLDADAFSFLGVSATGEFDEESEGLETFIFKYEPAWVQLKLPLQHNTTWEASTTSTIDFMGFELQQTIEDDVTCEGWGTLVTPEGSYPAIRCREESTINLFGTPLTSTTIEFHTKTATSAYLDLDEEGNVTYASYTTASGGGGNVAKEDEGALPAAFTLEQNYPNPFNPSTVIPFQLREAGHVSLKVYNTLGQEIETVLDGFLPAGEHQVAWDAGALPGGTYLYRMHVNGQSQVRPLTLHR